MQHGLFIVEGSNKLTIWLNDRKVNIPHPNGKRNMQLWKKYVSPDDYDPVVFDAGLSSSATLGWRKGCEWMKDFMPRFKMAMQIMAPAGRFHTSSLRRSDNAALFDVPVHCAIALNSPEYLSTRFNLTGATAANFETALAQACDKAKIPASHFRIRTGSYGQELANLCSRPPTSPRMRFADTPSTGFDSVVGRNARTKATRHKTIRTAADPSRISFILCSSTP